MKKPFSPVMEQYLEIKKKHPERLLFFRIGDFYELFFEDAEKASKLLDITLTGRGQKEDKIPMAGVPHHSSTTYIKKLIDKGESVVICEQVEGSENRSGPMKREITEILTPGTAFDDTYSNSRENNFLAAFISHNSTAALAWCDLCSGIIYWEIGTKKSITYRLEILHVKELLLSEKEKNQKTHLDGQITKLPYWDFQFEETLPLILQTFQVHSIHQLGIENELVFRAIGALVKYCLNNTQSLSLLKKCQKYHHDKELVVDRQTREHLSLDNFDPKTSLYALLNQTLSPMGSRLFQDHFLNPTRDKNVLKQRHQMITFWQEHPALKDHFKIVLKGCVDLQRSLAQIKKNKLTPRAFGLFVRSLVTLSDYQNSLWSKISFFTVDMTSIRPLLLEIASTLNDELPKSLSEGTIFNASAHQELESWKKILFKTDDFLKTYEQELIQTYGFPLKTQYNKIHGFSIEVSKIHTAKIPKDFIRHQTLKNAERYRTQQLIEFQEKREHAFDNILLLESELYTTCLEKILTISSVIDKLSSEISSLDVAYSAQLCSELYEMTQPLFEDNETIEIDSGRHLLVEQLQKDHHFISNHLSLSKDHHFMLITGPNMGGKSTYMRQQALIIFLSFIGSYVPAKKAIIPDIDRIFTRIGASDNITKGQSTFMVEMLETAHILKQASKKSFIIIDEVGRGTSTFDAMALAKALCEYFLKELTCFCLFATHYHDLISLSSKHKQMILVHMGYLIEKENIHFTYKLKNGPCYQSFGLHVASLAGIPSSIVSKAREYQWNYEKEHKKNDESKKSRLEQKIAALDLSETSPKKAYEFLEKMQSTYLY
jgi:DNA mismatch repair protein MutS